MSTVKITDLPSLTASSANAANSLFVGVDLRTGTTGKFSGSTLAQALYSNQILNVGVNPVVYPGVIGQFSANSNTYIQVNLQNFDSTGSSDYVASASDSDNANNYVNVGINGKDFSDITFSAMSSLDSYVYAYGPSQYSNRGNLVVGTASSGANVLFIAGGTRANNIVVKMTPTGITLNTQSYLTFADGSQQITAGATKAYTEAAYAAANTVNDLVVITQGVNTTQNTRINSIETINTNQNTSISIIQGVDTTQNTLISIIQGVNTTQNTNITAANNTAWLAFDLANAANTLANTAAANASYGLWRMDITTLINITQNNRIGQLESNSATLFGYTTQSGVINAGQNTSINLAWSTANNALANIDGVTTAGSLNVSGTVNSQKGFVYSPTVYPGAQTAITIDVSNNSLVRAQTSTGLVVTLSNLMAGKEVIAWITNTAGSTQTFTHGCSALNSTVNATTYGIPSTSTILARYMCIDTTTQNTFVAITKA